jgi:hypothetical protein
MRGALFILLPLRYLAASNRNPGAGPGLLIVHTSAHGAELLPNGVARVIQVLAVGLPVRTNVSKREVQEITSGEAE